MRQRVQAAFAYRTPLAYPVRAPVLPVKNVLSLVAPPALLWAMATGDDAENDKSNASANAARGRSNATVGRFCEKR